MPAKSINGDGQPQPAGSAGGRRTAFAMPTGDGPVARSVLEDALLRADAPTGEQEIDPNRSAGKPDPAEEQQTGADSTDETKTNQSDQADLEQNNDESAGEDSADTKQDEGAGGEEPPAKKLDENVQAVVDELATEIAEGRLHIGELKRVSQLLGRVKERDDQIAALQAELTEAKTNPGANGTAMPSTGNNPFGHLKSDAEVREMKSKLHDVLDWCEENPTGGNHLGKEYSEAEVAQLRRDSRRALDLYLPERSTQIQEGAKTRALRTQISGEFRKVEGNLFTNETEIGRETLRYAALPELQARPDGDILAAALAEGMAVLKTRHAARTKQPNGQRPAANGARLAPAGGVPRRLPAGGAGGGTAGNAARLTAVTKRVLEKRDRSSLGDFLEATGPMGGRR